MNFKKCLRPGGVLLIDHRNYDNAIETGYTSPKSIYYNVGQLKVILEHSISAESFIFRVIT